MLPAFKNMSTQRADIQFSCGNQSAQLLHAETAAGHQTAIDLFVAHAYAPFHTRNIDVVAGTKIVDITDLSARFQAFHRLGKGLHTAACDDDLIHTFSIGHIQNLLENRAVFVVYEIRCTVFSGSFHADRSASYSDDSGCSAHVGACYGHQAYRADSCGFGTVYEAIEKIGICGNDAVLVTGLGPVGLAALMLAKAMGANKLIGVEMNDYRIDLAKKLGLADLVVKPGPDALDQILAATGGKGVERAIDASASDPGRQLAIRATREWGKIAFVGEGGTCTFNPSPDIIHGQKTIYGSWVTSLWRMEELVERLVRWNIHPEDLITHEFPLEKAGEAYSLMAGGKCGKVAVVFND